MVTPSSMKRGAETRFRRWRWPAGIAHALILKKPPFKVARKKILENCSAHDARDRWRGERFAGKRTGHQALQSRKKEFEKLVRREGRKVGGASWAKWQRKDHRHAAEASHPWPRKTRKPVGAVALERKNWQISSPRLPTGGTVCKLPAGRVGRFPLLIGWAAATPTPKAGRSLLHPATGGSHHVKSVYLPKIRGSDFLAAPQTLRRHEPKHFLFFGPLHCGFIVAPPSHPISSPNGNPRKTGGPHPHRDRHGLSRASPSHSAHMA